MLSIHVLNKAIEILCEIFEPIVLTKMYLRDRLPLHHFFYGPLEVEYGACNSMAQKDTYDDNGQNGR